MSKSRHRAWCFTQFIKKPEFDNAIEASNHISEEEHIQNIKEKFQYIIYGREKCPTTEKKHLQGYCYFKNGKSMSAVKRLFADNTIHLEPSKGSVAQNIKYCTKSKDFWLWATRPFKGNVTT